MFPRQTRDKHRENSNKGPFLRLRKLLHNLMTRKPEPPQQVVLVEAQTMELDLAFAVRFCVLPVHYVLLLLIAFMQRCHVF